MKKGTIEVEFVDNKKKNFKDKIAKGITTTFEWVRENRKEIILVASIAIPVANGAVKLGTSAMASHRQRKEINFKERHIYDHSLGRYVELRKPLTSAQALTIEKRRANGEKLHVILNSMGLLK